MEHKIAETNARIDVADVLRGLAVMGRSSSCTASNTLISILSRKKSLLNG